MGQCSERWSLVIKLNKIEANYMRYRAISRFLHALTRC